MEQVSDGLEKAVKSKKEKHKGDKSQVSFMAGQPNHPLALTYPSEIRPYDQSLLTVGWPW